MVGGGWRLLVVLLLSGGKVTFSRRSSQLRLLSRLCGRLIPVDGVVHQMVEGAKVAVEARVARGSAGGFLGLGMPLSKVKVAAACSRRAWPL